MTNKPNMPLDDLKLEQARKLWKDGAGSAAIAARLNIPEHIVWNHLEDIKRGTE